MDRGQGMPEASHKGIEELRVFEGDGGELAVSDEEEILMDGVRTVVRGGEEGSEKALLSGFRNFKLKLRKARNKL